MEWLTHTTEKLSFYLALRSKFWSGACTLVDYEPVPSFLSGNFSDSHLPMSYHGLYKLSIGLSGTLIWELIKKTGTTTTRTSTNTETYASISKVLQLDKTYAITTTQLNLMSLTSGGSGRQVW